MPVNYVTEAERRWPNTKVLGNGRYAVFCRDRRVVYLAVSEQQARNISLGCDSAERVDLQGCPVPENCPDRFPD